MAHMTEEKIRCIHVFCNNLEIILITSLYAAFNDCPQQMFQSGTDQTFLPFIIDTHLTHFSVVFYILSTCHFNMFYHHRLIICLIGLLPKFHCFKETNKIH